MVTGCERKVPDPGTYADPQDAQAIERAIEYMGLRPGMAIEDIPSITCSSGRARMRESKILRIAASVVQGKKISPRIKQAMVVPGSMVVKAQAESEGLDKIFKGAGFEWHDAGAACAWE